MKKKMILLILGAALLSACATGGVGSEKWYTQRMQEIEASYQKKEITKAEYLSLKSETDKIRFDYTHHSDPAIHTGFFFGHEF